MYDNTTSTVKCTLCKRLKENPDASGACVVRTDLNDFYTPTNHSL